jgi:hypothetical protein
MCLAAADPVVGVPLPRLRPAIVDRRYHDVQKLGDMMLWKWYSREMV